MKHETHADGSESLFWHCPGCNVPHSVYTVAGSTGQSRPVWGWNGSVERCTLTPSVLVRPYDVEPGANGRRLVQNKVCHVFIRDGQIEFLGDCTHALAGQTVPVP